MPTRRRFFLGAVAISLGGAIPFGAFAALRVDKPAEQLKNGEFNWYPERSPTGPIVIIVSLPDQLVHVYRNGVRIAASTCSTGKPGHSTPTVTPVPASSAARPTENDRTPDLLAA